MCRNHQANKCQLTGHGQVQQRLQGPFVLSTAEEEQFDLGQSCFPSDSGSVLHQGQSVAMPRDSHGDLRTLTRGSKGLMHIKHQEHRDPLRNLACGVWAPPSSCPYLDIWLPLETEVCLLVTCSVLCPLPALPRMLHAPEPLLSGDSKAFSHSNFLENS